MIKQKLIIKKIFGHDTLMVTIKNGDDIIVQKEIELPKELKNVNWFNASEIFSWWLIYLEKKIAEDYKLGKRGVDYVIVY